MKNSHRFFNNAECEYFPCHACERPEEFNCLFCFCPLYFLEDCGGSPRLTPTGVKDCSGCALPHRPGGYDHVMARLRREFAARKASANHAP
ncbi:cysteine-rich small domain-containing protein [Alkalidesulfovibrio alkalitolerans DSM 16529]|jgi:Zn-finger protein|uniref:Cysteine-rich small domain-containing protein n=1 Tax=Alkalidesulfovibrio alkalitolerans DSM 16529 TaxID=1121439 RepID=S7UAS9_9BACT|nr:cysteine-rich small domain-containing protein [Alkalidesulfovibrio alkalitolerans]EPR31044.1 cysteine-rich small domain-containing protein [Alkalidesulfovibrio alkalitolerans DSM 16529]